VGRVLSESTGPVVRINPYEVHINDPEFYDELYVGASECKTDKWFWSVSCLEDVVLRSFLRLA